MRISDWCSDVCSSDLATTIRDLGDGQTFIAGVFEQESRAIEPQAAQLPGDRLVILLEGALQGSNRDGACLRDIAGRQAFVTQVRRQDRKSTRLNSSH